MLSALEPSGLHLACLPTMGSDSHLARSLRTSRRDAGEPELPRHGQARTAACTFSLARRPPRAVSRTASSASRPGRRCSFHSTSPAARIGTTPGAGPKRSRKAAHRADSDRRSSKCRSRESCFFLCIAVAMATATLQLVRHSKVAIWIAEPFGDGRWPTPAMKLSLKENGEVTSGELLRGYDLSRRSYDLLDPAGRTVFLVDTAVEAGERGSLVAADRQFSQAGMLMRSSGSRQTSMRLTVVSDRPRHPRDDRDRLPGANDPVELWAICHRESFRRVHGGSGLFPYLEWLLNRPDADRGHTQPTSAVRRDRNTSSRFTQSSPGTNTHSRDGVYRGRSVHPNRLPRRRESIFSATSAKPAGRRGHSRHLPLAAAGRTRREPMLDA